MLFVHTFFKIMNGILAGSIFFMYICKNNIMIDKNLKRIVFENKVLYYEVMYDASEWGNYEWTEFYETNNKTKIVKKWWLWGPLIEVPNNKQVFQIHYDIESCDYTKKQVQRSLKREMALLNRCEEIKKGEIV